MDTQKFSFKDILAQSVDKILSANKTANFIHKAKDIRGSGDEVEISIREAISFFLPEKYLVKQGHIIDSSGLISNQLDIIIFDRMSTPKFFESSAKSVYYPIESVLAIGEIKKTLRKNDISDFKEKISKIKNSMKRELIPNSIYGGEIKNNSI